MSQNIKLQPCERRDGKCGDIVVDNTGKYAYIIHAAENFGEFHHYKISNCVNLEKKKVFDTSYEADLSNLSFANIEERNTYFDVIRNYNEESNISHYESDNLIYAGTLLVFGDRYITMLLNNIPNDSIMSKDWSCMNTRDMTDDWAEATIDENVKQKFRIATDEETKMFWEHWEQVIEFKKRRNKGIHRLY